MKFTIYAVDFDGTLCKNAWPDIGPPNAKLIEFLKVERKAGNKVILNTMRENEKLHDALEWCKRVGLVFDAVNDNLPEMKHFYGNNPRKVYADFYIDDHNAICDIGIPLPSYTDFEPESGKQVKYGRGKRPKVARRGHHDS